MEVIGILTVPEVHTSYIGSVHHAVKEGLVGVCIGVLCCKESLVNSLTHIDPVDESMKYIYNILSTSSVDLSFLFYSASRYTKQGFISRP